MSGPFIAPYLVDGDPVSAEVVQEFLAGVAALDAAARMTVLTSAGTGSPAVTSSSVVVTNTPITFTTVGGNAFALVISVFDLTNSVAASTDFVGSVFVDGIEQTFARAVKNCNVADHCNLCQVYPVVLGAGAHTVDLRVMKTSGNGTLSIAAANCTLTMLVVDLP
ncbi:hypothetical protein [Dactylosporangium sp. CS-033363]|uniref:hypothetical protein n=1 Tax=Dactylosporangium sp. CS-033363 TaxID=3239935 RepID=UPI003D92D237